MSETAPDQNDLMRAKVSKDLLALFDRLRWTQSQTGKQRLHNGNFLYLRHSAKLSPYVGFYAGENIPEMGAFSYSFSGFDRTMSTGAYCSISPNVRVMGISHPLNYFSTTAALYQFHPMFGAAYRDAKIRETYRPNLQKPPPVIGNDVWIGENVLLAKGITVSDGAVIAAGSVVVKDVLPYQIVGGSPAKPIRYRFSETDRALLQWSRWWEYAMPDLMQGSLEDVPAFVKALVHGVNDRKIRKTRVFAESLADIIASDRVSTFLTGDDDSLLIKPDKDLDLDSAPR